jgi:hypothetical protein
VLNRFELYETQMQGYLAIKSLSFQHKPDVKLSTVKVKSGLYKPSALFTQHSLILTSITGIAPIVNSQVHGKRKRRTNSITSLLQGDSHVWPFHDKFLHELVPLMFEFSVAKIRKGNKTRSVKSVNLRFRKKIGSQIEFSSLVNSNMQDTYRGIYLPLTLSLIFNEFNRYSVIENYLRMIRLPVLLFRRGARQIFDAA